MRGSTSVLVFEYVTGGGLAGSDLPASWALEGAAMRRAVSGDFARVPGVRVVATLDARLSERAGSRGVRFIPDDEGRAWESLAAEVDYTVLVAPETGGILADLARAIARLGGRSLGSDPEAIALASDKGRLAEHFEALGIPTPPTRLIDPSRGLPTDRDGPIIVKPVDGAGSIDTFVVLDPTRPPEGLRSLDRAVVQPYLPGLPSSASFLVDREGRAWQIAVGRQRIEVDDCGRLHYRGGTIGEPAGVDLTILERAVTSVRGLRGFVGVDFIEGPRGEVSVLEINPRPTTSYAGMVRFLPPGTIAGAWLASVDRGLAGTGWPERLRVAPDVSPVTFEPDGSILSDG